MPDFSDKYRSLWYLCLYQNVSYKLASPVGVEPTAFRLGGEPSIRLRYGDLVKLYTIFSLFN